VLVLIAASKGTFGLAESGAHKCAKFGSLRLGQSRFALHARPFRSPWIETRPLSFKVH
jgi:hypothetical protein